MRTKLILMGTDAAGELVVKQRTGDHGKFLVAAAESSSKLKGIEIKKQSMGTNPIDGQALETVDWAETIKGAQNADVSDAQAKVDDFEKEFYEGEGEEKLSARQHRAVVNSYKQIKDRAVACGRR
ncbi:hypothetical protein IG631_14455 [Alternaria alternata]|nr:hypothetical protein IG631_14455 [Alternaria alternata]